jgi:hypothetical protein
MERANTPCDIENRAAAVKSQSINAKSPRRIEQPFCKIRRSERRYALVGAMREREVLWGGLNRPQIPNAGCYARDRPGTRAPQNLMLPYSAGMHFDLTPQISKPPLNPPPSERRKHVPLAADRYKRDVYREGIALHGRQIGQLQNP